MWCRKRIDIGWADLWQGFRRTLSTESHDNAVRAAESALFPPEQALATLSVRSGFDLLLQQLELPHGSAVLMSAVTITDMAAIVEAHGLIPVPVDLDPATMGPDLKSLEQILTPNARAIVVAHLFGTVLDLEPVLLLTKQYGLLFIEDCAQAFDGKRYQGHPAADVVMFSFGPIKTATALAGGILLVRDPDRLATMRILQMRLRLQPVNEYRRRICTYALLKLMSGQLLFGLLMWLLGVLRRDPDAFLNGAVRNFPADQLFERLRQQPCPALLQLMARRLRSFDLQRQDRRAAGGQELCRLLTEGCLQEPAAVDELAVMSGHWLYCPGYAAVRHTWWIFPLMLNQSIDREKLLALLAQNGFDATAAGQLRAVSVPSSHSQSPPIHAQGVIERVLFLPFYPELSDAERCRMGNLILQTVGSSTSLIHEIEKSAEHIRPQ